MGHARRSSSAWETVAELSPEDAPGVAYFDVAEAPGLKFFACERYRASLSQQGCALRWLQARNVQGWNADRFEKCRACPVGASHAGRDHIHLSPHYDAKLCPRCETGQLRIIADRICVNCYNREREQLSGRNARGNAPVRLQETRALRTLDVRMAVNGRPRRVSFDRVTTRREIVLRSLRNTVGQVSFGWSGKALLRQESLF